MNLSILFFEILTEILSEGKRRSLQRRILPQVMARIPSHEFVVDEDRCFGCGACIALCPVHVLTLENRMIYVDEPNCTHCRLCIPPVLFLPLIWWNLHERILIGGTIEALVLAHHLQAEHHVFIIELEAELGYRLCTLVAWSTQNFSMST